MLFPWDSIIGAAANLGGHFLGLSNWKKQQDYNHPARQRARLEQANLNPALMYKGGLQNTAGPIQTPAWQTLQPQLEMLQVLNQTQDLRLKESAEDRENRTFDQVYELNQIRKEVERVNALRTTQEVDEFLSKQNIARRDSTRAFEHGMTRDKYRKSNLETQIYRASAGELKKYAKLLPSKEYNLLTKKLEA